MIRKCLKVCDGVNLIISPCQYKGFNLNPGILLFDADTPDRHITGLDVPFVATYESDGVSSSNSVRFGRPMNIPRLSGFKLNDNSFELAYVDIDADNKSQTKILNAVDLALGKTRLHNLLFTRDDEKYIRNVSFGVYDPNTSFKSTYTKIVGNVFLQHTGDSRRDKAVLLTKTQVNLLNELSPYGIMEYGKSDLKLKYNRDEYDNGNFHDLLYVLGNDKDSMGLKKTDVDDICSNLKDYYTVTSGGFECIDVNHSGVLTMCDDDQMLDDFHIKPFMIKLSPDLAKKYLCYADNGEYVDTYKYYDFDGIVDDKSHSVYLTSIAGYDTDGYSFDDATYIGSDNALYSGYYFDGYSFVKTRLALTDAASDGKFDLSKYIYNSLDEANYVEDELLNCKDIDELRTKVKNRQDELRRLAITDSSFSKEDARILNYVYGAYLSNQEHNFDLPIDYEHEQLTDAELQGRKADSFDIPDVAEDDKSSEQEYD